MKRILTFWMTALVITVLVGGALASAALAAQPTATGYDNVQLWVDPEYDDPSLLVMMQGTISGATAPCTVEFLVPTSAVMYSAGSIDANGNYSGGPPTRVASQIPGWDLVSYTATTNTFRVEYYDNIIEGQPNKTIDYMFRTELPISQMNVSVQQPLKATKFVVDPSGTLSTDNQGFNIETYSYGSVAPGSPLTYNISYYKTDNIPSEPQNTSGIFSTATPTAASSGGSSGGFPTGLLAAIIIVVVVAGVASVYLITRRTGTSSRKGRRGRYALPRQSAGGKGNRQTGKARQATKPAKENGGARQAGGGGGKFCTNCGAPLDANAKFCRECGTPRRQ